MPREQYLQKVQRIKDYIAAGDIYQANLAQRWSLHTSASPIDLFRQLMLESPLSIRRPPHLRPRPRPPRAHISASPELFLHRHANHLITRPIKGTRPRDLTNPTRDQQLHNQLLHSEKDQAELAMIVDLLRNELGRVAQFGSVQVTSPPEIQQLPTLWHALATIEADLPNSEFRIQNSELTLASLLRAIMPGGSITGAPKIRAMQIIEQLEPTRRGLYCAPSAASPPATTPKIPPPPPSTSPSAPSNSSETPPTSTPAPASSPTPTPNRNTKNASTKPPHSSAPYTLEIGDEESRSASAFGRTFNIAANPNANGAIAALDNAPIFAASCATRSEYASPATNSATVSPIPLITPTMINSARSHPLRQRQPKRLPQPRKPRHPQRLSNQQRQKNDRRKPAHRRKLHPRVA